MVNIVNICDGVYRNDGACGPEEIDYKEDRLYRFMDKFYIRCSTDELTPVEVSELCRERALHPEVISSANEDVRNLFKSLIDKLGPTSFLEIGAGNNPILQEHESAVRNISYVRSDADPDLTNGKHVFSGLSSKLTHPSDHFQMAAAVFVLHFHFYVDQIAELYRCISPSGIFIANVYRRSPESREALANVLRKTGFFLLIEPDPRSLCRDHQYWIAGKDSGKVQEASIVLLALIKSQTSAT
ncbi:hypothetical protein SAMN05518854_109135 [Variovorax sp. YR266]|nr:hypothetical protein SAMN05518854_109135 [Variovorax sp. YR266]